jgi:hypothetical protein
MENMKEGGNEKMCRKEDERVWRERGQNEEVRGIRKETENMKLMKRMTKKLLLLYALST